MERQGAILKHLVYNPQIFFVRFFWTGETNQKELTTSWWARGHHVALRGVSENEKPH